MVGRRLERKGGAGRAKPRGEEGSLHAWNVGVSVSECKLCNGGVMDVNMILSGSVAEKEQIEQAILILSELGSRVLGATLRETRPPRLVSTDGVDQRTAQNLPKGRTENIQGCLLEQFIL